MAIHPSIAAACRTTIAVVVLGMLGARMALAQSHETASAPAPPPSPIHVLALKQGGYDARPLLESALDRSATIRHLVEELNASDVVVYVALHFEVPSGAGDLRLMPAVPGARRMLIRIDVRNSIPVRYKVLGHELQHAAEVASATDVRDEGGMRRLFERIGIPSPGGFETHAAVHAGYLVYEECFSKPVKKGTEPLEQDSVRRQ